MDAQNTETSSYSLRYSSRRVEVWRWYWRAWRSKFWLLHLLIAEVITWITLAIPGGRIGLNEFLLRFLWIAPIVVVLMASWPQVAFKKQERFLEVGPEGWSSRIGKMSGSRSWAMVAAIRSNGEVISIVSTTGNALLIPRRAFEGDTDRQAFLADVVRWHRAYPR
jgi:hypothetical protein